MLNFPLLAFPLVALLCTSPALADDKPVGCQYVEVATLPVKYAGASLEPTIPGTMNGKPARMLMDTGADLSALTQDYAEKLDLNLQWTGRWASGIGGEARLYSVRVNEMTVGPSRAGVSTMRVIGAMGSKPSFDVIVGAPFLLQADLEMNLADREIKFFRPQNCKDTFLGYWKDVPVTEIPYNWRTTKGPNPHFTVELNGHPLDAMIDSGAPATFIELAAARRAGLRLDAPDVRKLADITGVGERKVAHWSAHFDRLAIGDEHILDARISVMESQGERDVDILLGRDFLRQHRVLFAKSQKKLYISYTGTGDVFVSRASSIEPWLQREADEGNPDAEFQLANLYRIGTVVPKDLAKSSHWIELAARHGHPGAELAVGRRLMSLGRDAEAAPHLRAALDQLPDDGRIALWLYIARLRANQAALGQQELDAAFKTSKGWPAPVAQFYLGRQDAATLFAQAAQDAAKAPDVAKRRICDSAAAVADLYAAQGKAAETTAVLASHGECKLAPRLALAAAAQ
ncbi:aspartyl protease family protein [Massilia sp. S19_KUP03_FR1]|uniref:aspartyl protease family protein n=1 Tax=Massilia sp. S19_KUP03_FR1 TaxID=3025503 RepID=UPI002FCD828F